MLSFGAFAFAAPMVLFALAALPVIWWLVRIAPPTPRRIHFPALRLLRGLEPREEEPARTPLWLMALRLFLTFLIIIALARPLLHPRAKLAARGPVILVVDNDWAAAADWDLRKSALLDLVSEADREGRQILLLPTAARAEDERLPPLAPMPAAAARAALRALKPKPWSADRMATLAWLKSVAFYGKPLAVWLSDGIRASRKGGGAAVLADYLKRHTVLRVLTEAKTQPPVLLVPGAPAAKELEVFLESLPAPQPRLFHVRASGSDGRLLVRRKVVLKAGERRVAVPLPMPSELRNEVTRIAVEGVESAGAVLLVDERWHRRPVGIVSFPGASSSPLLSGAYYLERALAPFTEVRTGTVRTLLRRPLAVLVYSDGGPATKAAAAAIRRWVAAGGLLLRFAGPRLAASGASGSGPAFLSDAGAREPGRDRLLPIELRRGGRTIGGALSWERPETLAPFGRESPFAGLSIPSDLTVSRQVLAEPGVGLGGKIWARLADGTPLVTAAKRGRGWVVLVHTTANASWSNLALSGLFVDMLRRIVALSEGVPPQKAKSLPPLRTLDAFGHLGRPPPSARAIAENGPARPLVSPSHPPGFYGSANARRALNLFSVVGTLEPISSLAAESESAGLGKSREIDLRPYFLAAAMVLALVDLFIAYLLRGFLRRSRRPIAAALFLLFLLPVSGARAGESFDIQAAAKLHLAYIETGDENVDRVSREGLAGLSRTLEERTAVDPGSPEAIDPEHDPLVFFPLIYWPLSTGERPLSPQAVARINRYLESGGTILFDALDGGERAIDPLSGGNEPLRRFAEALSGIRIPPLVPIPPDHVLTKSFYLLNEFPGRWNVGTLWIEPTPGHVNDGVSSVIFGDNDWAAAWATDKNGRPLFPVVPGGARQREMARRFGVNLVMYVLTGNYKNDQLQVPEILRRLGR